MARAAWLSFAMRLPSAILIGCALLAGAGLSARADQADPRLDALFTQLKADPNEAGAMATEQRIWAIWLEVEDEAAAGLLKSGMDAMNDGDLAAALASFDALVAKAPGFAEGWNKRATLHYMLGNYAESLADIEKTLALEPRHFGALAGRGLVHGKLEDFAGSLASFEAALAVNPHLPGARASVKELRRILKQREI
ncbi:MAG: tetratricopeptide repeat protein [Hyphomicrobiales bacterium]